MLIAFSSTFLPVELAVASEGFPSFSFTTMSDEELGGSASKEELPDQVTDMGCTLDLISDSTS